MLWMGSRSLRDLAYQRGGGGGGRTWRFDCHRRFISRSICNLPRQVI